MSLTRRNFLQRCSLAAFAAASVPLSKNVLASENTAFQPGNAPGAHNADRTADARMTKAAFAPFINTTFTISGMGPARTQVKLVQMQDIDCAGEIAPVTGGECFSLAFVGADRASLKQNTYRFSHPAMGEFDLFIGAVKSRKHGQVYEAIINHRKA